MNNNTAEKNATQPTFTISTFRNKADAKPKLSSETWQQLIKRFSAFKMRADKDGPLFSPATFTPAHRSKENVHELSMLVLDYDHGAKIDEACAKWESLGLRFALHTTHSHQRATDSHPQAEDCFRIIIPLSEPISAAEFPRLWQWADVMAGGKLDAACKDASRVYYLPARVSPDAPHDFRSSEGAALNWRAIELREEAPRIAAATANLSRYAARALKGEAERVTTAPVGERNNALNRAAYYLGNLVGGGVIDRSEAEARLGNAAAFAGLGEKEAKATINSGLNGGAKNPRTPSARSVKKESNADNKQPEASDATLATTAERGERQSAYESAANGLIYWQQTGQGEVPIQLTNFCAEIVADVLEDDGVETRRAFEVSARLGGKATNFIVLAEDFMAMKWPMENLGAKAIIHPRRNDHARCAIQMLSPAPSERHIFTHTGWRDIDGQKVYLHGGGAIGAQTVDDVEVRLPESLQPAILPAPVEGDQLKDAVAAVVDLAGLANDGISLPAIGAAFSSVVGGADFSIWLYGATGSGKSQLAALIQSFFGCFNADKLPGSWMSTANALEGIAHAAKDMVFVVDDFKPTGGANDRTRLYRDADRLLRAQGNQHGRQRLAADTTQRKTKHPRGLIFNTAEEVPRGESLIARLFVLEFQKNSIDFSQLSALQKLAARGAFASMMSSFIRWLATNYSETIGRAPKEIARWRDHWADRKIANHRRYSTTLGHLTYSWSLWLRFAQEVGALTDIEASTLWGRVLLALALAGGKQDDHTNAQNPVTRFLEMLQSAFASQKAHLECINAGPPTDATDWGWRRFGTDLQPCGDRIGWHTGDELYLLPDATFALLERISASGAGIGVDQSTLWKHLHEAGLLSRTNREITRGTYRAQRAIGGQILSVLVFCARKLHAYTEMTDSKGG